MTIQRLREIAALHHDLSAYARKKAERRRKPATGDADARMAKYHLDVGNDLNALADAFSALTPLLTSAK